MATRYALPAFLALTVCFSISVAQQCPDKAGYVTKANTNWVRSEKTQESQTAPANAEHICKLDSNCIAFNNFGYYILRKGNVEPTIAATGIKFSPYDKLCTYVKATALPACPEKAGYNTKDNTNWVRSDKTQESQTLPANAEQICNLDSNCLAFNNFGYYILKSGSVAPTLAATGVKLTPYDKLCTYVKTSAEQAAPIPPPNPGSPKQVAFRNPASKLCFAVNENERLPLGIPRLLLSRCSAADKTQTFKMVQVKDGYNIVDSKGRCVTTFSGLIIRSAGLMNCGANRADQLWFVSSVNPNGKGPYTIKSKDGGVCITQVRQAVSLGMCNPADANSVFESASV